MNEENNELDEFIEAPEDDDFGEYESPENENPEAVQAMIGGPNWVFPDLVRVQSSNVSGTFDAVPTGTADVVSAPRATQHSQSIDLSSSSVSSTSRHNSYSGAIPRTTLPRALDPPDVSLLPSTSASVSSSNQQPNTIDLCSSIRQNAKLNFSSNMNNTKNGASFSSATSSHNIFSPISSDSSSSASSSIATNLSGLVLSNSSSSSSQTNLARACDAASTPSSSNVVNSENHFIDYTNPTPSTSGSYNSSATLIANQKFNTLEREIRTLEMQKALLQTQMAQKDGQIDELQRALSSMQVSNTSPKNNLEEIIVGRINDSFDRLNANLDNTMRTLERRIELLEESRFKLPNGSNLSNGKVPSLRSDNEDCATIPSTNQLADMLIEIQKRLGEQQRQEMCALFRSILTSAIFEIDNFANANADTGAGSKGKSSGSKANNVNGC